MYKYLLILLLLSPVYADEELSVALKHSSYEPNYFGMMFGLVFVIALIYLSGILYKKMTKIKFDDDSVNDKFDIQIISSQSLGQNKNLYIIKVNSAYSLIGATQNNISYIKDLNCSED